MRRDDAMDYCVHEKNISSRWFELKTRLTESSHLLQDDLPGAALLPVCQECALPSASLQSQEGLDLLQAAGL